MSIRIRKVEPAHWRAIYRQAYRYPPSSSHPACLTVEDAEVPCRIDYLGRDGFDEGFTHAVISYDRTAEVVTIRRSDDVRAASELKSYLFLKPLLFVPALPHEHWATPW